MAELSVIVPVHNGAAHISATLETLLGQTLAGVQILVVDDGSTDDTAELAQLSGAHVVSHESNQGKEAARLLGMMYACQYGADLIIAIDVGRYPEAQDIFKLVTPILNAEADMVVGRTDFGHKTESLSAYLPYRNAGRETVLFGFDLMACTADAAKLMRCSKEGDTLEFELPTYGEAASPRILELSIVQEPSRAQKQLSFWQKLSPFSGLQYT